MGLLVCFLFVVFDLITARQLRIFDKHSKEEPIIRRNVEGIRDTYAPSTDTVNLRTLKLLERELGEIKHLIMDQGIILKRLERDQIKLIKERDKNRKRHRSAKKYLRKIYHSCKCQANWFDPRKSGQRADASSEFLSNVVGAFSQRKVATIVHNDVGVTNQPSVYPTTQISEEHSEGIFPEDVDLEDVVTDVVLNRNSDAQTTPTLTIYDRPFVHTNKFVAEAASGKRFVSRMPVVDNNDDVLTTPKLTIHDRLHSHTKQFFAEAASGKGFTSRIPVVDGNADVQTTPRLTVYDRPYVHTKTFVAEAASGKGFVSRIPVVEEKEPDYDGRLENGILRDDSMADIPMMLPTEDFVMPTEDGRTWPEVARYVMTPFKGEYDVTIDLALGHVTGNHSSVTFVEDPLQGIASYCIQQSVVKLAFGKPGSSQRHDAVLIDITFDTPSGWVFNIGDSSTNDGRSGDSSKQENDCEVDGHGTTFSVYGSDKSPDPWSKLLYQKNELIKERLSMIITDQLVVWNNFAGNFDFIEDASLFALNGQPDDQGPVNYDIFLGLNRVIGGHYRSGRGLCTASLKWL